MSILKFSDGEEFDTSCKPRIENRKDGLYVIGNGQLIPTNNIKESLEFLNRISIEPPEGLAANIISHAYAKGYISEEDLYIQNTYDTAEEVAEDHEDDEEIGSSDFTFILKEFLDGIGKQTGFVKGYLTIL